MRHWYFGSPPSFLVHFHDSSNWAAQWLPLTMWNACMIGHPFFIVSESIPYLLAVRVTWLWSFIPLRCSISPHPFCPGCQLEMSGSWTRYSPFPFCFTASLLNSCTYCRSELWGFRPRSSIFPTAIQCFHFPFIPVCGLVSLYSLFSYQVLVYSPFWSLSLAFILFLFSQSWTRTL